MPRIVQHWKILCHGIAPVSGLLRPAACGGLLLTLHAYKGLYCGTLCHDTFIPCCPLLPADRSAHHIPSSQQTPARGHLQTCQRKNFLSWNMHLETIGPCWHALAV